MALLALKGLDDELERRGIAALRRGTAAVLGDRLLPAGGGRPRLGSG